MEWESVLGELVAFVKDIAPELWAICLRQVLLDGIGFLVGTLALLAGAILSFRGVRRERAGDGRYRDTEYILMILGYCALVMAISPLLGAINRLGNPEYFAIKSLLGLASLGI